MQHRLNQNDVSNRINVESATQVRDAVLDIFAHRYPAVDFALMARAFDDVQALFEGRYPGYLACDTLYHDIRHTLDITLATARLVDGHDRICAPQDRLGARRAALGVIVALLHDSGYMRRTSEANVENGAVFTKVHVSRSADILATYLPKAGFAAEAVVGSRLVHFTGYEINVEDIEVDDPKDRLLGCMVGTADLIGQMSDRLYLEKCRDFLYQEFVFARIARETLPDGREIVRYSSPEDLIIKTPGFYEYVARKRIDETLLGVDAYAAAHFGGDNLYTQAVEGNFSHLREILEAADFNRLRRLCYSLSSSVRRAA
ncbi:MAG: hypothetical protein EXR29_00955 [Betaproteobacteria bacterium]|nr:hypothetical protein [Betaproteobacteria bacterium]